MFKISNDTHNNVYRVIRLASNPEPEPQNEQ